jgi:hypothetical protein
MAPYQVDNIIQALSVLLTIGGIAGAVSLVMYVRSRVSGRLSAEREQQLFDMVERLELTVEEMRVEQAALREDIHRQLGSGDPPR